MAQDEQGTASPCQSHIHPPFIGKEAYPTVRPHTGEDDNIFLTACRKQEPPFPLGFAS